MSCYIYIDSLKLRRWERDGSAVLGPSHLCREPEFSFQHSCKLNPSVAPALRAQTLCAGLHKHLHSHLHIFIYQHHAYVQFKKKDFFYKRKEKKSICTYRIYIKDNKIKYNLRIYKLNNALSANQFLEKHLQQLSPYIKVRFSLWYVTSKGATVHEPTSTDL